MAMQGYNNYSSVYIIARLYTCQLSTLTGHKQCSTVRLSLGDSISRNCGSAHNRYVYGLEPTAADVNAEGADNPLALENKQLQKQVEEVQHRVRELELQHSQVHQNLD